MGVLLITHYQLILLFYFSLTPDVVAISL